MSSQGTTSADLDSECASALFSVADTAPTFPPDLESWAETATQNDPCHFTGPASLSSEYSVYTQNASLWISSHESQLSSLVSKCPMFSTDIESATASVICPALQMQRPSPTSAIEATSTPKSTQASTSVQSTTTSPVVGDGAGSGTTNGNTGSGGLCGGVAVGFGFGAVVAVLFFVGAFVLGKRRARRETTHSSRENGGVGVPRLKPEQLVRHPSWDAVRSLIPQGGTWVDRVLSMT